MWISVVYIITLFQICSTKPMNPFQNSFSHNYTYKTYYTYQFGNVPPRSGGERTVIGPISIQGVPKEIPPFIQEHLRRENIQIHPSTQEVYEIPNQNIPPQHQTNNFHPNQHPSPFEERPQPNVIHQPGGRKSREDNPTSAAPINSTPPPQVSIQVNSSSCYFGFCENVTNYPEDMIKRLLSNNNALEAFFRPKVPDIGERFNNDFENLCTVRKSRLFPKVAMNLLGKEKIVVNIDGRKQAVDSETCSDDAMCRFTEYWPIGYKGKCVQKYVQIPLAVMDDNNQNIVTDIFSYPSGCYCACKTE